MEPGAVTTSPSTGRAQESTRGVRTRSSGNQNPDFGSAKQAVAPLPSCMQRGAPPRPIAWHVARWGEDPWSRSGWCTLRPGASPADRAALAEPIDGRLVLAGEAVDLAQPGMVHG